MLGSEPVGEGRCFGNDAGFCLAALPPRTIFLFHKVHCTGPPRRASPVIQRCGKRPITGHVRLENHQTPPPHTTPVFQGIVKASPPVFIVEIGT